MPLFSDVTELTGVKFTNHLTYTEDFNPYTYRNFYNGAGVAIGDINNDGLNDIYFSGNQTENKLFLNKGNLVFEDITGKAGVACKGDWSTGVTFADVNSDGLLDLYVCKSGKMDTPHRYNELFINKGDLTFEEKAKEFGLDVIGLSVHAAFFDYDKDGDLDCYLLSNSVKSIGSFDLVKDQRNQPDPAGGGNKFLLNDKGKFLNYSKKAGIYTSNIGFGLGITLGDFNNDSWTDIFVSNDFFERDYLYINNQQGGFKESLTDYFESISLGSMGADFADLDNDGYPELFVTEMLPDSLNRRKSKTVFESWNKYTLNVQAGYYHQFSRNVLQKRVNETSYAEIGRMAGVAATEWSWGALLFDMNNDGLRDIFVANGILNDLLDRDYLTYTASEENVRQMIRNEKNAVLKLISLMPRSKFSNYAFLNKGDLQFQNRSDSLGLGAPMFSNGSAYADLDNDGDLDLVINNVNSPCIIYRNNTDSSSYKSISLSLSQQKNLFSIGARVTGYVGKKSFQADNFVNRGYQSSIPPEITMGLGENIKYVDSLIIRWPDEGCMKLYNLPTNKKYVISKEATNAIRCVKSSKSEPCFELELVMSSIFEHKGSGLVDFNRDRLLPMMYSNETPNFSKGDVNRDGFTDLYLGGGKDQSGCIMEGNTNQFKVIQPDEFRNFSISEETRSTLFDVDGDGDLDLYLAAGGRFFPSSSSALIDHVLINDGRGNFSLSKHSLPFSSFISTSSVVPFDFDNDKDMDIFIGERFHPFTYGIGGRGYLLRNEGNGRFDDVSMTSGSDFEKLGMVTDAVAVDLDNDNWQDLVIVGDWEPIRFMHNEKGVFIDRTTQMKVGGTEGWWHRIKAADLNKDGRPDFVLGNHGLNSFFKSGDRMYVGDFDQNGSIEQIFCTSVDRKYYPIIDKDELVSQIPSLKRNVLYYKDYGHMTIENLFQESALKKAEVHQVQMLTSVLLLSTDQGYKTINLPQEAQYAPIYALSISDFDGDGVEDLLAGGNQYKVKPQFGRLDASRGWFFKGIRQNRNFSFMNGVDLGVKGEIRDIDFLVHNNTKYVFFAKNNEAAEVYKVK